MYQSEVHQLVKLREEETEKKTQTAWKFADFERETFLHKVVRRWSNRQPLQNCHCVCEVC
jgi:hypothetical protein